MAKIGDLLAAGPTYSFEFPPPRTPELLREFEKTLRELEPVAPSFCSVTYGAGGSSRDNTLEAVLHIQHDTPMLPMPHLTCVAQTRDDITALVERYRDEGIENLLALAGDPPVDNPDAPSDFRYATELIELARGIADFSICVAAFPEVHPRSPDRAADRQRLAAKLELADFAITQFFWDAEDYFRMRDELDALGATTPIVPSLFPIINVATAKRFTTINGAAFPDWLADQLDSVADDPDEVRKIGIDVATMIGQRLLDEGVPGLHIYTLNRSTSALAVWENLGLSG
ncbi:MAG TPA: methylenetetrahydrofolate reductase [Acidimicrobiales bacterium]|nr:methylenetetrahydrofolate reductase [Acidimicrobiales bacterium]